MAGRDWSEGSDSSIEETKLCVGGEERQMCVYEGKGERCVREGDEREVCVRGKGEGCV